MSHFTVIIFGNNPEEQLAPFQENNMGTCPPEYLKFEPIDIKEEGYETKQDAIDDGYEEQDGQVGYWHNPNQKWDWYVLGGRWTGYFKLKKGCQGTIGKRGVFVDEPEEGHVDQCLKGDIDIEWMREDAKKTASEEWEFANGIIQGESFLTWQQVREKFNNDMEKSRNFYASQGVLKRWDASGAYEALGAFCKPEDYSMSKEKYVTDAANAAIASFAVIKDGEWHQRGDMGWWGVTINDKGQDVWNEEFNKLFDSMPDTTMVSVYDCHI